ncbi:dolichyl pyrophosphate Man9GlcNAc2 alpha-1,3-glucosyltransferase-like isoform X2 [Acanthaster planci]|uniref:Alpha-1,3-glucosyltransferase n=1 Tax=Acanthaster planci TaxID=133434 RepID=A0A8B7ZXC1_ACAPL|nr:dolichyl pyrophosphate Man9GlcNAc2 alpha-1,3-glucosyltransferase-like isoform X2 [Acanthaster planci]
MISRSAGTPPMFGDYEAQRHWMEITTNLPIKQWYTNTTDNDLLYWGLDYPPLTAYHSWLCGIIAYKINPDWVALNSSRGYESREHKLFMRYSVLAVDVLLYIPAVLAFCSWTLTEQLEVNQLKTAAAFLLYPGLIVIDHGHFQYNCASLGFALWAMVALATNHDLLGSIAFVLALNYKQMELYHALPFFCCLLARCIWETRLPLLYRFWKLVQIGVVVVATFVLCWLPFLSDMDVFVQVLRRLFPFDRGLFEDKVSNFWCSISVIIKIKNILSQDALVKLCLATTGVCLLPLCADLLRASVRSASSILKFHYSLINSSLVFFLFSYQVHEKSILLVALPVCCLLDVHPLLCSWFLLISTFSMLPLLIKDQLFLPYLALCLMFLVVARMSFREKSVKFKVLVACSLLGAMALSITSVILEPPARYPDLYAVLVSVYSCAHFLVFLVIFYIMQLTTEVENIAVTNAYHISRGNAAAGHHLKQSTGKKGKPKRKMQKVE